MDKLRLDEADCNSNPTASGTTKTNATAGTTASHDESQPSSVEPATRKTPTSLPSRAKSLPVSTPIPIMKRKKIRRGKRNSKKHEVGFKKDKKLSLPGYNCYNKNRKNKSMGGVATAFRKNEAGFALKTAEGKDDEDEFIITRHAQFSQPINILNMYGSQEGRNSKDNIEEKQDIILEKISGIERVNEEIIIIGDMNRLIGNEEYGVKGNNPNVTPGG